MLCTQNVARIVQSRPKRIHLLEQVNNRTFEGRVVINIGKHSAIKVLNNYICKLEDTIPEQ